MTRRILVADDDPDIRDVIRFALEAADFDCIEARDGAEALARFAAAAPDLVVLDIGMPERDGLEVCRAIRRAGDTPILFLTARDEEVDRVLGLEMGGDDYVTKPFSPRELVARVRAVLRPILDKAGVAVTRGLDFDPVRGHKTLRFSYARSTEDIEQGLERLRSFMADRRAAQKSA